MDCLSNDQSDRYGCKCWVVVVWSLLRAPNALSGEREKERIFYWGFQDTQ